MKNITEEFSHSCRYVKYLSFALVMLVNVLWAEEFGFPCEVKKKKKLDPQKSFWRHKKIKVFEEFQVCWIFHIFKETWQNPASVLATGSQGFFCFCLWAWSRLNKIDTCQMGKLVQHHLNMSHPLIEQLKVGAFFQALFLKKIANLW